jgi:hypothetical protein
VADAIANQTIILRVSNEFTRIENRYAPLVAFTLKNWFFPRLEFKRMPQKHHGCHKPDDQT